MKLKIIMGDQPYNSSVVNAATGELIENVSAISWSVTADQPPAVTITIIDAVIECTPPHVRIEDRIKA